MVSIISGGKTHLGQDIDGKPLRKIEGEFLGEWPGDRRRSLKIDKLLAPLVPTDILCIGLNYREHAAESNSAIPQIPMLFIKARHPEQSGRSDPGPQRSSMIDYEGELAIVIGKDAKNVSRERALDYVFGYTCANDVTRATGSAKRPGRRTVRARQELRRLLPDRPVDRHERMKSPIRTQLKIKHHLQRPDDAGSHDRRHDLRRAGVDRIAQQHADASRGAVILTGTPQGVGFAQPAGLAEGGRTDQRGDRKDRPAGESRDRRRVIVCVVDGFTPFHFFRNGRRRLLAGFAQGGLAVFPKVELCGRRRRAGCFLSLARPWVRHVFWDVFEK